MTRDLVVLVPGPLGTRTGGYEYDRQMISGLSARGWRVIAHELDSSFPHPTRTALDDAARLLASAADNTTILIDGLAFGAMPAEVRHEFARLKIVALIHLPLAAAVGLEPLTAAALKASEQRALEAARLVVVTGMETVGALADYGVDRSRIDVVEPGTDPAPLARGTSGGPIELLSVGSVSEGKGHELLIRALAMVPERHWHLTCAGSLDRDPPAVKRVRDVVDREQLADRVSLVGELNAAALDACYDRADVFVLATLHETYGMAVAEALARGLPVVSTSTGAIPMLVGNAGRTPAGLLAPPGNVTAMALALSQVLRDAALRSSLAEGARQVRERLPRWDEAIDRMDAALEQARRSSPVCDVG
jgi:glycosyltransferase involved in cell wall biosynthesis